MEPNLDALEVNDLTEGQIAFVEPWAIFSLAGDYWIAKTNSIEHQPEGTVCCRIQRYKNIIVAERPEGETNTEWPASDIKWPMEKYFKVTIGEITETRQHGD